MLVLLALDVRIDRNSDGPVCTLRLVFIPYPRAEGAAHQRDSNLKLVACAERRARSRPYSMRAAMCSISAVTRRRRSAGGPPSGSGSRRCAGKPFLAWASDPEDWPRTPAQDQYRRAISVQSASRNENPRGAVDRAVQSRRGGLDADVADAARSAGRGTMTARGPGGFTPSGMCSPPEGSLSRDPARGCPPADGSRVADAA